MIPVKDQIEGDAPLLIEQDPASASEKPYMKIYDSRQKFVEDWHACTEQGIDPDDASLFLKRSIPYQSFPNF